MRGQTKYVISCKEFPRFPEEKKWKSNDMFKAQVIHKERYICMEIFFVNVLMIDNTFLFITI